jgi:hypothetical protein
MALATFGGSACFFVGYFAIRLKPDFASLNSTEGHRVKREKAKREKAKSEKREEKAKSE